MPLWSHKHRTHHDTGGAEAFAGTEQGTALSHESLQPLENKALSRGIIGKSAPILAEITIRKSHPLEGSCQEAIQGKRI